MALWVAVHGLVDKTDKLDANSLNRPIRELTERTSYLYDNLQSLISAGIFESVRLPNASLVTGTLAPVVGDFVYLDSVQGKYAKAQAGVNVDTLLATNSSLAMGILIYKNGNTGTLVLYGKADLTSFNYNLMLESGETFRNGPYFLSALTAGKMTAAPSGPSIYLGYFMEDASTPGYGGYVMMSPQYKDVNEAHVHRSYPMFAQPAGTQYVSGPTPIDTHAILGFEPIMAAAGGDHLSRIVLEGVWAGTEDVDYTIWLSASSDPNEVLGATTKPTDYSDAYLHWLSSDVLEGSGAVRVWSYDTTYAIGTKGVTVALQNTAATNWDTPYTVTIDDEDKRTWIVSVPDQTEGWLARYYRTYFTDHPATDNLFSFILQGGPASNSDSREWDQVTVKCGELHRIAYTANPLAASTVTVGTTVFEFNTTLTVGTVLVGIGVDADESFQNLLDAILAASLTGIDAALNADDGHLMICTPTTTTVSTTVVGASASTVSAGAGSLSAGTAALLVYDEYHQVLVATTSYWGAATYWTPTVLKNNLSIIPIPYDSDGTPATADTIAVGDYWDAEYVDEAPGAYFVYSMGMHASMNTYYPPLPVTAAALILNGVEMDSEDQFPLTPTYRTGPSSIYWYSNYLGSVPWPRDWVDINSPGSAAYQQKLLYRFVNMSAGDTGLVTSCRPAPNSPIKILRCGTTDAATTGDLAFDLDLAMSESSDNLAGYQVFKKATGSKLRKGPVVEKITSRDGTVTVSSSGGAPLGQGIVDLSVGSFRYEGDFEEVALQNAKQELLGMFPYIRLLGWTGTSSIPSGFVAKFRVPHTAGDAEYKVVIYLTVFGETSIPYVGGGAAQFAGVDFSYSILPDFVPSTPPSDPTNYPAWNSLDRDLSISERLGIMETGTPIHADIPIGKYDITGLTPTYTAYDPMLIHNNPAEGADEPRKLAQVLGNPFPNAGELTYWDLGAWGNPAVRPGSLVAIRVQRSAAVTAPAYTGTLGFISLRWRLVVV